ncbi:MAG: metal transporter [Rubinisphaera sp.]|uniref:efflux RND transporter periplasmic adaptor subunit n=1 Tax=Rubinisphaera sp. TaxID=2024857 RepID=UPI000C0C7545|nr:efflux RND transporter periplasmic adaptor subunit [Rubinisphaera sp.]MBV07879.1 metal transporter [Rubinisphaera sp.]
MNTLTRLSKSHSGKLWAIQAIVLLCLGLLVGFAVRGPAAQSKGSASSQDVAGSVEAPSIWTCSMHPQIRRDGPGKCPICGMDLVPVKKSAAGVRTISISENVKNLMKLETVPIGRQYVTASVRMVGKVDFDETRQAFITAWVSGRLDRLYVDFAGIEVKKGDHMAYIYSEELYTAQRELIEAIKSNANMPETRFSSTIDLAKTAREKLRLLGITAEQIQEIEDRGSANDHITIYSPISGVVIEKLKQEGDRVRTGDRIYSVADLNQLWVQLDAYESDLMWIRYGQEVEFTSEAYPGEVFKGRIAFIDPVLNEATRTVKVRVNIPNSEGRLKPNMFVSAIVRSQIAAGGRVLDSSLSGKWISPMHPEIVKDEPGQCDICGMPLVKAESLGYVTAEPSDTAKPLVIPVSAALLTGTRAIVYVQVPDAEEPTYEGREIVLGPRAGDYYLVKAGLEEGDLVVTNGNFKLDSALQISAKPSMMTPFGGGGGGGHNHGGGSAKGSDENTPGANAGPSMSLPKPIQNQLHQIMETVKNIEQAVTDAELQTIRQSFTQLGEQVATVDVKKLPEMMQPQWKEFAMLLRNDAVEGQDVKTMQAADTVYRLASEHAKRLQKTFGLAHADETVMDQRIEVPAEFRDQLRPLLAPYLAISSALAADDASAAQQDVETLHTALQFINSEILDQKASRRWTLELQSLSSIVARLSTAGDIAALRSAFALLSEEMLTLQRVFGLPSAESLYELHCPMAFEGRGATWLQTDSVVQNPYYGAAMLKCADRVEPLNANPNGSESGHKNH